MKPLPLLLSGRVAIGAREWRVVSVRVSMRSLDFAGYPSARQRRPDFAI
jgi:hypothetical protein